MSSSGVRFFTSLFSLPKLSVNPSIYHGSILQTRNYALRKGTREKLLKKKLRNIALKRVEEAKRPKKKSSHPPPDAMKYPETNLTISPDNVWIQRLYSWKTFPFNEAVKDLQNVFHPTIYDFPGAKLKAMFEINLKTEGNKKNQGAFRSLVSIPHKFAQEEHRAVLAFGKTPEQIQEAKDAGATAAGPEMIRLIRIGEMTISDFNFIVAHPAMLSELLPIKGILKNKFPSLKQGNLGVDLKSIIYRHLHGINYTCTPNLHFPEFGLIDIPFGTIGMEVEHLRENFKTILDSVQSFKPKKAKTFIIRVRLHCPPFKDNLKIDLSEFIKEEIVEDDDDDDDDDTVARAEI